MLKAKKRLEVTVAEGAEGTALLDFPTLILPNKVDIPQPDGSLVRATVPARYAIYRPDTNEHLGDGSDQYHMVPHLDAKRAVDKCLHDAGHNFHSVTRLVGSGERCYIDYHFPNIAESISQNGRNVGDVVNFKVRFQNSLDGRKKVGFSLGAERLLCSNGMTAVQNISSMFRKHRKGLDLDAIANSLTHGVNVFHEVMVPFWNGLSAMELTDVQGLMVIDQMINENKVIPTKYAAHVESRWTRPIRWQDKARNAWVLYNAFTDASTHAQKDNSLERSYDSEYKVNTAFRELVTA